MLLGGMEMQDWQTGLKFFKIRKIRHVAGACNEIAFSLISLIRIAAIIGRSRNHVGH